MKAFAKAFPPYSGITHPNVLNIKKQESRPTWVNSMLAGWMGNMLSPLSDSINAPDVRWSKKF